MIDQLTIDKIRDTAQIMDVVGEFVSLRRRGQNYIGLCPFHADKNPSFYVSPSKNICKCFSCGEGGDPVNFLMKHEQMNYMEAIRWLGKKYGIEIQEKEQTAEELAAQTAREGMMNLNEFAQKTFEHDLYETDEGRNIGMAYFRERGLQDETIRRFHLGYALESKTDFASRALKAGHKRDYLLDPTEQRKEGVGLCYGDDPQKTPVCRFAGRVIFPFHTLSGKPVAFGGRILQRVDHAFKKYVNSPESMVYHKGNLLYGIFQAKNEMAKQDKCFIVEGNVDVLSMSQAGFTNVVASAGTALTTNQIRIIQRFTKNVTLMFDGDDAGIRASLKTIDLLLLEGMNVKLLLLPDGNDPDSFCRAHSTAELEAFFSANEQDFISYKTAMLLRDAANDPLKRSQVVQNIVQSIALISDPIMSSLYMRETSQRLHVSEEALIQAVRTQKNSNYAAELRRMETDLRREEARAQREQEVNGDDKPSDSEPAQTATADSVQPDPEPQPQTVRPPSSNRAPLLTDRYERNIIQNLVRHGGKTFTFSWTEKVPDENGREYKDVTHEEDWRVVDFIGSELYADQVEFRHPVYARMLQMAIDASADTNAEFDSVRFFTRVADDEIRQTALDLVDDRYDAMGIAQNQEDLSSLIPRCLLELKEATIRMQIAELRQQLRTPGADYAAIMPKLTELTEIKKNLDKALGERIITA